jgi:integrase
MPKRSSTKLSDRLIKTLPLPTAGSLVIYDADLPGFGIRLTASGARSFVFNYVVQRRERRLTIGRFPTWSTTAAREEAKGLKRQVNLGIDPLEVGRTLAAKAEPERSAPTVRDLFLRYAEEHLPRKALRAAIDDRRMWERHILPVLGAIRVAELSHDDVDRLHAAISATRPVAANRVVEVLRKALNLARRWGWRQDNPAVGVRRNREERRERFLKPDELTRLTAALAAHPDRTPADAIHLLILTGARRSEVFGATWDQFDLDRGVWVKPAAQTKQRRLHRVPLSGAALELLRRLATEAAGPCVFPGRRPDRPLTHFRPTWVAVCGEAGLTEMVPGRDRRGRALYDDTGAPRMVPRPTLRIHDLRHTYASLLASNGLSLPVIGALLGHTAPQTTARYAHLLDDALRAATETAADVIAGRR